ncbi:hypothetical protein NE237_015117 [Protea cynaroides]|uniref:PSI subunit V n=1 Tax=Protea cynaroides TaxID=273540 RepID=A0A9Q0KDN2_9MAGN|nr:hypothetical protein NE237_015117 [Protea cynaroides]
MAAASMASQLKSNFTTSITRGVVSPKGISGTPLRVLPSRIKTCFTIKAVRAEKAPVTSSPLIAWYLSNLPSSWMAVNPLLRGVEVGLAHGLLLVGPFVKTGPLRNTEYAGAAGLCLTIYGAASFNEGEPSTAPSLTLTGIKKVPDQLQTADGWA